MFVGYVRDWVDVCVLVFDIVIEECDKFEVVEKVFFIFLEYFGLNRG